MGGVIEQLLHRREAGTNGGGVLGTNGRLLAPGGAECRGQRPSRVAHAMRQVLPQGFRLDDKAQYALVVRIIDGDVGLPHNLFRTEPHGCLCVYNQPAGAEVHPREPREDPAGQPGAGGTAALPRPAPGHGVCGPGGLPARGGHQPGQEPAVPPSWTTAAAWTPCGWSRRCVRWWRASSGCTSTRTPPRSRGPGRTCG
ncbi:hypothetical protein HPB48_019891 [Haemaphysalis longicornis]|uniref:Uncharacterized protein n=1 Tax=Haemaphysalis longicornis TaxID=44386 RepID=A0A9J6GL21_HAELO|nr:hypothetical protein HPB48_019891 [Haemaphysalis longicornis]